MFFTFCDSNSLIFFLQDCQLMHMKVSSTTIGLVDYETLSQDGRSRPGHKQSWKMRLALSSRHIPDRFFRS